MTLTFTVFGEAIPQGSAKAFMRPGAKYPVVTSDNPRLRGWRQCVAEAASSALAGTTGWYVGDGPVTLVCTFHLPRPKALGTKHKPHLTNPDLDKLARAVGDALTGVLFRNDSQVVSWTVTKAYAGPTSSPRVDISVATGEALPVAAVDHPPLFPELARHP